MARLPILRKKDSTPAKQVTGTSYVASGAVQPPPLNYGEQGSSIKGIIPDTVPELSNPAQASRTYRKMIRTDVSARTSLRAGKAPVLGGEFFVESYDADPANQAIKEFVEWNLFEAMSTPWLTTGEQILRMYEDGCSVFEEVWELREWAPKKTASGANRRQYTTLKKLAVRPRETIRQFNYDDNGGPVSVAHNAIDAKGNSKEVTIPISKLIVFTFDKEGGGLEGNSILRSAYEHWFYKYHLYKIDAIQKERHAIGVPEIELQPGYSEKDVAVAWEIVRNMRTNERAGIVRTTMMKIGFAEFRGMQLVDVLKSIQHHDTMIMKNVMVQFLNLGVDSSGGGRATGATSMDMFLKSMNFIGQTICDAINLYLIPNLVAYNFPTDKFPKLSVRGIGEQKDMQMWSASMRNLVDSGVITMDEPTEQWARQQADMPKKLEARPALVVTPSNVKELLQRVLKDGSSTDSTAGGGTTTTDKSKNGGAGNVGKSDSSGAV